MHNISLIQTSHLFSKPYISYTNWTEQSSIKRHKNIFKISPNSTVTFLQSGQINNQNINVMEF